jgi:type IV pilus assembly protein PilM
VKDGVVLNTMDTLKKPLHHVVGLDIGTYSLKLVESRFENNRISIDRILVIPFPDNVDRSNSESLGKWLASIWKKENIKTRMVRLTIPRSEVLTTELDLPLGSETETIKMLELQVERDLPVPIDSVNSDYFILSRTELGDQKILVISARKELIEFYRNLAKQAKLHLDRIELSLLSLNRAIQYGNPTSDSWIIVNLGYSMMELMIVDNKNVTYSRSASFGIKAISDAQIRSEDINGSEENNGFDSLRQLDFQNPNNPLVTDWFNQLVFELKRSLESYTLEYNKPIPKQIIFYGGGSCLVGLIQSLQKKLGIQVQCLYTRLDENNGINNGHGAGQKQTGSVNALIAAAATGLVLPVETLTQYSNLNQPRLFAEVPFKFPVQSKQIAIGVGIIIALIFVLLGVLYQKQRHLAQLQTEYTVYRPLMMQAEQININMNTIRSWKQESNSVLEILRTFSTLWPDDAYLQIMTYDRTKDITISGLASSNQAVSKLLKQLNDSNQFIGIKLSYSRVSKRNPTYPVEFGLSMKYKKQSEVRSPKS